MRYHYQNGKGLVQWTVGLLIANIIASLLYMMAELAIGIGYPSFYDPNAPLELGEELLSIASIGVAFLLLATFVPTVIVFCICLNRLSKNARALGARHMRFTPGWTVGYFFIPILNLFRPYQAVKEIEKASSPGHGSEDWVRAEPSGFAGLWWTFWITSSIVEQVSSRMANSSNPATVHSSSWPGILSSILTIAAGYFVIRVLLEIHRRQDTKVRIQPQALQSTCIECGYDIRGTPGLFCPECGTPIPGRDQDNGDFAPPDPTIAPAPWAKD